MGTHRPLMGSPPPRIFGTGWVRSRWKRPLDPRVAVDGVVLPVDQLAHGHDPVAPPLDLGDQPLHRFGGVLAGIVEEDDFPRPQAFQDPLHHRVRGEVLPVQRVDGPLDGVEPHLLSHLDQAIVVLPEGRPEEGGLGADQPLDQLAVPLQVLADLVLAHGGHVAVGVAVVADLVAGLRDLAHVFGVLLHPVAGQEEGGLHPVAGQDLQQAVGVLRAPGGVEREGDPGLLPLHLVDGHPAGQQEPAGGGPDRLRRPVDQGGDGHHQDHQPQEKPPPPHDDHHGPPPRPALAWNLFGGWRP